MNAASSGQRLSPVSPKLPLPGESLPRSPEHGRRRSLSISMHADAPVLRSPEGWTYPLQRWLAFLLYFMLSANDGFVKAKSKRSGADGHHYFPYSLSSVMLVSCAISLMAGVATTLLHHGLESGLQKCFYLPSIKAVAPINALFQVAFVLKFEALRLLEPDVVSLLSQGNLVLLALASRIFMGRLYPPSQWISLVQMTLLMFLYLVLRGEKKRHLEEEEEHLQPPPDRYIQGYCIVLIMSIIETCATIWAETFLKQRGKKEEQPTLEFWVQKVHVDLSGLILTFIWVIMPYVSGQLSDSEWISAVLTSLNSQQILEEGLFSGWDRWTVAVVFMVVSKAWLAGLVAKLLDSVVKQIGSCLAIGLTYVEVVIWSGHDFNAPTIVSLALLLLAMLNFVVAGAGYPQRAGYPPSDVPKKTSSASVGQSNNVAATAMAHSPRPRCESPCSSAEHSPRRYEGQEWVSNYRGLGVRGVAKPGSTETANPGKRTAEEDDRYKDYFTHEIAVERTFTEPDEHSLQGHMGKTMPICTRGVRAFTARETRVASSV